ncbi:MAG: hypothetical protein EPO28_06340 [Saprospiraceae bacterium]|nr:MAG: hypothetical protein EPO28_06340 [Saprospiraceae bacterium]
MIFTEEKYPLINGSFPKLRSLFEWQRFEPCVFVPETQGSKPCRSKYQRFLAGGSPAGTAKRLFTTHHIVAHLPRQPHPPAWASAATNIPNPDFVAGDAQEDGGVKLICTHG